MEEQIGLDFLDAGPPPAHVMAKLRERVPFELVLGANEVVVTGADFETMRRHLSSALLDPEIAAHLKRGW